MKKLLQSIFITLLVVSLPSSIFAVKDKGGYRRDKVRDLVRLGYIAVFVEDDCREVDRYSKGHWSCSLCEKERWVCGRTRKKRIKKGARNTFRHMKDYHDINLNEVLGGSLSDDEIRRIFDEKLDLGIQASFDQSEIEELGGIWNRTKKKTELSVPLVSSFKVSISAFLTKGESLSSLFMRPIPSVQPVVDSLESVQTQELPPIRNVLKGPSGQEQLPSFGDILITGHKRLREEGSSEGSPLERVAIANLLNPIEFEPEAKRRKFD